MDSVMRGDEKDICFICGIAGQTDVHHIFGGANRSASDRNGLTVHLCRKCHIKVHSYDGKWDKDELHKAGQKTYESRKVELEGMTELEARNTFIREFYKSYL